MEERKEPGNISDLLDDFPPPAPSLLEDFPPPPSSFSNYSCVASESNPSSLDSHNVQDIPQPTNQVADNSSQPDVNIFCCIHVRSTINYVLLSDLHC